MSKYTTEVRFICEQFSEIGEDKSINEYIDASVNKVFDFDFPMFDEEYRKTLETKILKHYYTREIGFETVELWRHWLDMRMNEIMPYYNQLYKSATYEFNPLYDVDIITTSNRKTDRNEKEKSASTRTDNLKAETSGISTRTDDLHHEETHNDTDGETDTYTDYKLYSDTPQNGLNGVDDENYLTSAQKDKHNGSSNSQNNGSSSGSNTGTEKTDSAASTSNTGTVKNEDNSDRIIGNVDDYIEHVQGKRNGASYSAMILEYRKTLLNIDMMIIDSLSDLFMNVW